MSTQNEQLGDALLKHDAASAEIAANAHREAERALRRDRRRIGTLAGLAILSSVLAAAAFYLQFFLLFYVYIPNATRGVSRHIEMDHKVDSRYIAGDHIEKEIRTHQWRLSHSNCLIRWMGASSVVGLTLAALATILLVFTSRRAALRQVNVSLLEISNELQRLQQTLRSERPPESG
jgi:hypothetical protein